MPDPDKDFRTQPTYTQTTQQNDAWVNVTITKTDLDGSRTQISFIAKK